MLGLNNNQKLVALSAAQEASWTKRMAPVLEGWQSGRPNGKAIYDKFLALVAEARAASR